MISVSKFSVVTVALIFCVVLSANAQTRKRKIDSKPAEKVATTPTSPIPKPSPEPPKRNERPDTAGNNAVLQDDSVKPVSDRLAYRYEFTQPDFVISRVLIEHNNDGKGTISFKKKGEGELITDPIKVSQAALDRINAALTSMNFLDSTEDYQYEKDFSHLGNIKFGLTRDGRTREVAYNWTSNKDAKTLMNQYRKITNQFVWIFDISLSRENQPLEAPKLFDNLDSMIKRNEISDPYQLEPFLKELSNDERIPLMARNHAVKVLKQFEKDRKKDEK